jgi:hypothetical protein
MAPAPIYVAALPAVIELIAAIAPALVTYDKSILFLIANAPNPAGMSILREHFPEGSVSALWLFVAALPPTIIAVLAFQVLK